MCPHCLAAGVSAALLIGSSGLIATTLKGSWAQVTAAFRTSEHNAIEE